MGTNMENLYKPIKTSQLLQYVQMEGEALEKPEVKKKMSTKAMLKRSRQLGEARMELMTRLKEMDRYSPDFFPVGCKVEYRTLENWYNIKRGKVIGHEGSLIIVDLIGEQYPLKVEPRFLKLMYIRQKY